MVGLRTELSSIRADRDASRQKCIELAELCDIASEREEQAAAAAEFKMRATADAEVAEAVAAAKADSEALVAVAVAKARAEGEAAVKSAVAAAVKEAERCQHESIKAAEATAAAATSAADEARAEADAARGAAAAQAAELSRLRQVERECAAVTEQHAGLRDQYRKLQADHRVLFASVSQASDSGGAYAASANGRGERSTDPRGHAVSVAIREQRAAEERAAAAAVRVQEAEAAATAAKTEAAIATAATAAERERTRELHAQLENAKENLKLIRDEVAASREETESLKRHLAFVSAERQSEIRALREALHEKAHQAEESHAEVAALRLDLATAQEQARRFIQEAPAANGQTTSLSSGAKESNAGRERESEAAASEVERAVAAALSSAAREAQRRCDDAVDTERARAAATRAVNATAEATAHNVLKRELLKLEEALFEAGKVDGSGRMGYAGDIAEVDDEQLLRLASIEDSWPVPIR
eukprot:53722-Pleurochrysis_carterae.AAC.1